MTGVEIDMVVADSKKALKLYENIFQAEVVEATDYETGLNEAVFNVYGTRFHLLDQNPEYGLFAPKPEQPQSIWFTVMVPDVKAVFESALAAGCTEIQPVAEMPEMGITTGMFVDAFGYVWMVSQLHEEVSFEDRCQAMEEKLGI